MALVEQQVEHSEHLAEPLVKLRSGWHSIWYSRHRDLPLGSHQPLGNRGFGSHESPRDLGRGETANGTQREPNLALAGESRMAASQDQTQPVVLLIWTRLDGHFGELPAIES